MRPKEKHLPLEPQVTGLQYYSTMSYLPALFKYVDEHQDEYVKRLADWVAVQSVSAWPEKRGEIKKMMEMAAKDIERLGGTAELVDIGKQKLPGGDEIPLPPIILGRLGSDPGKKTVCIYGHLDVQPAHLEDGWDSEPFTLVERDGKLYGRGSTDDKGPVLAWFNVIEAFQKIGQELPINIKFCFEGMEESGSEGLDDLVFSRKDSFFKDVDYVCISDNYWLGKTKPCITYGLRGICYFFLEVECCDKDLHSGVFGGSVHEAMTDLITLMGSLVDKKGKILVPGMYDSVAELTEHEKKLYEKIEFDLEDYTKDVGAQRLLHSTKEQVLMHRWRYPSLSLHGIEGAFSAAGAKTVIPRKVIGKFSIRLVPDMDPKVVEEQGAGGNWATVGRRSRGGRRVRRQREKRKGKGRELADVMERRKVDILCVQETRWKGSKARSIGAGFKLFYYGVDSKRNGVGVVLKEEFVRNVLEVGCELEEKERFWSELDEVMESIPTGDEEVMGKFGVKERNLEGQMVVDFAKRMDMGVVNTYFQKREEHRVTYKSGGRSTQKKRQKLRQALGGQVVLPDDWETTAEVIRETGRKDSIQRKRLAKKKWDMDRTEENRQEYKELQRRVKREVSKAKQKAYDELYTRLDTREGEKDLYRVLTSEESVQRRWKEYFEELMNEENEREKRVEGVNSVEQKVDKIRKDEVRKALKRMKSGKAVGPDDIPVEVWKCLGEAAVEFLASLFNRVLENLEKAYDRVPREELWYCMRKSGVAEKYVRVVQDMYERSRTVVRCAVGQTEEFNVEVGLHQGSALSPFLFAIVMDQLSEEVRQESPWTMMFADDIVICSESREQVEENLERWRFALERRGMKVTSHINKKFAELESPNKIKVYLGHGAKAWVSDFNHPHYMAGRKAMKTVFGVEPDLTREGGSIPVTLTFQEATGRNVMLLPVGSSDDGAHSQNEKLNSLRHCEEEEEVEEEEEEKEEEEEEEEEG
ncbi:hypothetical protein QTP70_023190 [Hemibagrus guttatus]|uniref:Cytosolic non-specific dipeptidase n=1 Tax=Hemibagrus guttatus TaxID=175788 RepID=A0AAE0Q1D6_9TELE|nr:hypothetical protein QTP70_023190 [Hemibagrus guttatus]